MNSLAIAYEGVRGGGGGGIVMVSQVGRNELLMDSCSDSWMAGLQCTKQMQSANAITHVLHTYMSACICM